MKFKKSVYIVCVIYFKYKIYILWFRKYLCAPATSTQAERVFSAMAWLLNKRRLALTGSHVNEQMVLKFNLSWE